MKLKERYVVDEHGKKKAVVLDMEAYRQLMEHLENLEDALELDQAIRESKGFRSYDEIRGELKQAGRL